MASYLNYYLLILFFCLSGCSNRPAQEKNLNKDGFKLLSESVTDNDIETELEDFFEQGEEDADDIHKNFYKKISISVTNKMKLKEVIQKISNIANVDVFIADEIDAPLTFTATNKPYIDIIDDICDSCMLKYNIVGRSIKIEQDSPDIKIYNVQSLNLLRSAKSSISTSTDIFLNQSNNSKPEESVVNNGSSSVVSSSAKSDFWAELTQAIKTIIEDKEENSVCINRNAGLLTVYTTHKKHQEIKKYLDMLKDTSEAQVLIEAKILEVSLKDEYRSGIDWNIADKFGIGSSPAMSDDNVFAFGLNHKNYKIIAKMVEHFGAVKTLSSPRITVLHNQSAILKVAKNEVIYLPELQHQYPSHNDSRNTDIISTSIKTIPIGLVMSVQPAIDKKNNTIVLNIRPTISRIIEYKEVPFMYQTYDQTQNPTNAMQHQRIPVVDVREFDSVLKLKSGQVAIMGGLMSESAAKNTDGLPVDFEPLNVITDKNEHETKVSELVVFLRAKIIRKGKQYHNADKKIYNNFADDPRTLRFKK